MYIRYFFLFIIFNMVLGVSAIGMHPIDAVAQGSNLGNPLYLGGCYWDGTTTIAQTIDPVEYGDPSTDISDTLGELTYPTNSTSTSSGPTGDGNIINSITDFTEATGKTIETIKNFMGGTYVIDDCFLDAGARVNARKYKNRINARASQVISEHFPIKDANSKHL